MPLRPGETLGPYEIVSLLGSGGMGEVYRARDPRLGRDVAIKIQRESTGSDHDRLRRFEQEARAASLLNHPNIIAIYDLGTHDGRLYVVTELLEGATLRETLNHGPVPFDRAIEWTTQMVRGVAAAHRRGIVHRDLKPENVFITRDGMVKLLDFGIAKLTRRDGVLATEPGADTTDTTPGAVLGSAGYMSPEQARGLPADHRSDIFAVGSVLYEMVAGRRAFSGASNADTVSAILHADPPALATDSTVPPAVQRVIRHCLEKDPESRFQAADDLLFALEDLDQPGAGGLIPLPRRAGPVSMRERVAWSLFVAAAIVALALGVMVVRDRAGGNDPVMLRVAGGPTAGVYHAIATGLVELINRKVAGVQSSYLASEASFQNLQLIDQGRAELAITQNDIAFHAVKTDRALGHRSLRICGLAALYGEAAHIIVNKMAPVSNMEEMRGRRVNLGMPRSGTRFSSTMLLQHFGIGEKDLIVDGRDFGDAVNDFAGPALDAAIAWRALPAPMLPDLYRKGNVQMLSLNPELIKGLQVNQPFWTPLTIPAGTYPNQREPVTTIGVRALLVASCDIDRDVVMNVLSAVFDGVSDLIAYHQRAAEISLKTASRLEDGMSIDLHPGAEQFYRRRLR